MIETIIIGGILIFFVHSVASYIYAKRQADETLYYTAFPKLERIDGIVYAHDQNGDFIGQGKTRAELIASMTLNLPNKVIAMDRSELEKVGF